MNHTIIDYIIDNPIKTVIVATVLYNVCFGTIKLKSGFNDNVLHCYKLTLFNITRNSVPFYSKSVTNRINKTKTETTFMIKDNFLQNCIKFQPIIYKDIKISNTS
jgi:hypothetical protein